MFIFLLKEDGVHSDFCIKLDFEIAADLLTRAHNQTSEKIVVSERPPVPVGQPPHISSNFVSIIPNHQNVPKKALGCFTVSY